MGRIRRAMRRREHRYVLVLSLGRSGSTLLQGILNSVDGWTIRGENANACHRLFELMTHLQARRGSFDGQRFIAESRQLVVETILRPESRTRVLGFKEVRYDLGNVPDLDGYLAYLTRLFPGVRFVVNIRNPERVARSGWWADAKGDVETYVRRSQDRLVASAERGDAPAYVVRYESYVDDPAALEPLFDFLGESFREEAVRRVLARRHSY